MDVHLLFESSSFEKQMKKWIGNSLAMEQVRTLIRTPHLSGPVLISGPTGIGKHSFLVDELKLIHDDASILSIDASDGISSIRSAISECSYIPSSSYRSVIIRDAHLLSDAGQDAILKILEEPPQGTVIFLISDEFGWLSDPIISRIRNIMRWDPIPESVLSEFFHDPFAASVSFGSFANCEEASKSRDLRPFFNMCVDSNWPFLALTSKAPKAIEDLPAKSTIRKCVANVLRHASRTSPYGKHLLKLSSSITRIQSLNVPIHWFSVAAEAIGSRKIEKTSAPLWLLKGV